MSLAFLRLQGFVLGVIHLLCSFAALTLAILSETGGVFNDRYPMHYNENIWVDCKRHVHEKINVGTDRPMLRLRIRDWCNKTSSDGAMSYADMIWFDVGLGWFVFVYFIWTGLFHLFYVTFYWKRYSECIEEKRRFYLRWLEYAVSAGIMMLLIVYFLGITNVVVIVMVALSMFLIIILPFVIRRGRGPEYFMAVVYYIILWLYLFITFIVENMDYLDSIPWFVYVIVFGEFILYSSFALIFLIEEMRIHRGRSLYQTESAYNLMSAASKLLLGLVLGFTVFYNP